MKSWTRRLLVTLALAPISAAVAAPNLLVIVLDDVGVDKVSSYAPDYAGYDSVADYIPQTTTIDSLADAGLRFSSAWSSPLCSPSRASMVTGRLPFRTGVGYAIPSGPELDPETETTIAQVLKDSSAGPETYATAVIGKWHVGLTGSGGNTDWFYDDGDPAVRELDQDAHPIRAGFDFFSGTQYGSPEDYTLWGRTWSDGSGQSSVEEMTEYPLDTTVNDAVDWISAQSGPWLAYVALNAAHTDGGGSDYEADDLGDACHTVTCIEDGSCDGDQRALYQALVECADTAIGDLLEALPTDALENTVVVVVGDNGSPDHVMEGDFADYGDRDGNGKGYVYESGVHVPLIVADGGEWLAQQSCTGRQRHAGTCDYDGSIITAPGRKVSTQVQVTDLFATLVDTAGFTQTTGTDAVSLVDCYTNVSPRCAAGPTFRTLYTEEFQFNSSSSSSSSDHDEDEDEDEDGDEHEDGDEYGSRYAEQELKVGQAALRYGKYKLVARWDLDDECFHREVFDLESDPFEWTDLSTTNPVQLAGLTNRLQALNPEWMVGRDFCST